MAARWDINRGGTPWYVHVPSCWGHVLGSLFGCIYMIYIVIVRALANGEETHRGRNGPTVGALNA